MMSAAEYRARAEALVGAADRCGDYELILELETTAKSWRWLAEMADWQDALSATLAARGGAAIPAEPDDP